MNEQALSEIVSGRLEARWDAFSQRHPNLAAVIDRTRLIESSVEQLRRDPSFAQAMREAGLDEAKLASAARLLEMADGVVKRILPLP